MGRNVPIPTIGAASGLRLVAGDPAELYGCASFSAARVLDDLHLYEMNAWYPQLAQLTVWQK